MLKDNDSCPNILFCFSPNEQGQYCLLLSNCMHIL